MNFLKKIKNALSGPSDPGDKGIYLYIKLDRTGEVVRLRLTPEHELLPDYDEGGYYTHKSIVGPMTFSRAQAVFRFDQGKKLVSWDIDGGELVTAEDWESPREEEETGA